MAGRSKSHLGALRAAVRCLAVVIAFRVLLTLIPYARFKKLLPKPAGQSDSLPYARQVARGVRRAARLVPRASCLTQALAAQYLLARSGHLSKVHVGIAADGGFAAHAWVVCQGEVVLGGDELYRFRPLVALS